MQKQSRENKYQTKRCVFFSLAESERVNVKDMRFLGATAEKRVQAVGWSKKNFLFFSNLKREQILHASNNHLFNSFHCLFASFKRNLECSKKKIEAKKNKLVEFCIKYRDEWLNADLNALFNGDERT